MSRVATPTPHAMRTHGSGRWHTLLAHAVMALLLLFAQQHALMHWLGHSIDAATHKVARSAANTPAHTPASTPADDARCDECLGLAGLNTPLASAPPATPISTREQVLVALLPVLSARLESRLAFQSRAPPRHLMA